MRSLILAVAALVALPTAAAATTWCYPNLAACPSGVGTATSNVETAATTNRTDGTADRIYLGANATYTDADSLKPTGSDHLAIIGAGPSSVLTSSSTGNIFVVDTQGTSATVTFEDLRIVVPASFPDNQGAGMQLTGDLLDVVDIDVQNVGSNGIGAAADENTILNTHIYASGGGSLGRGVDLSQIAGNKTVLIQDSRIDRPAIGVVNDTATNTVNVTRTTITDPAQSGVTVYQGGDGTVRNSLITVGGAATALSAGANNPGSSSLTVDHVTVVKTGAADAAAVRANVINVDGAGSADVTVTNSIFRGYTQSWDRVAPTSATIGDATISIAYSDLVAAGTDSGDGATTLGAGNIDADPGFVGATDFHLTPCSPAIDAGADTGTTVKDLDGNPRVVDGNGDGVARRDMGAYELQTGSCPPPNDPASKPTGYDNSTPISDPAGPPADTTAPVISGLVRRSGGLAFALSESATVTIRLAIRRAGRKVSGKCRKPTRANRRHKRCQRWVARKPLSSARGSGNSLVALAKLPRGIWRAVVVATDAAGNRSQAVKVVFRVRR